MKKILFSAHSLGIGGIETALVTLLNKLIEKYEITLVLEKKEGIFLNKLNPQIQIIEYTPCKIKMTLLRKIINLIKQIKFKIKYKNKFDFAAAFATYSLSSGFVAKAASKNSAIWIHADYLTLNSNDAKKTKEYYNKLKVNQFKKVIFVSKESQNNFLKLFPTATNTIFCNNLIDGESIIEKSKEHIEYKKDKNKVTFLNVGRHDERQKRLTRLINVAKRLKDENFNFEVLFVGDGQDRKLYEDKVKNYNLEDTIIFIGKRDNPYPYYKISDCVILTSDYEGFPVVFLESMILGVPLITTKISDYEEINGKFGMVTEKDEEDIYEKMKYFIEKGFEIKEKFDYKSYNLQVLKSIENLIQEQWK